MPLTNAPTAREHPGAGVPDNKTRRCGRDADSDQAKSDAGRERERTGHPVPEERYDEQKGPVELQHTVVDGVSDVKIADAVDGDALGPAQAVGARPVNVAARGAVVAAKAVKIGLANDQAGRVSIVESARAGPSQEPVVD